MKKTMFLLYVALMIAIPLSAVLADSDAVLGEVQCNEVVIQVGNREFLINEKPHTMAAEPFNLNGRVYVPMDFFGQAFVIGEQNASWRVGTDQISVIVPDANNGFLGIVMQPNSNKLIIAQLNGLQDTDFESGKLILMDATPVEKNRQIFVPLRWVAEALGFTTSWEADGKTEKVFLSVSVGGQDENASDEAAEENGSNPAKRVKISAEVTVSDDEGIELNLQVPVISGLVNADLQERINGDIMDKVMQVKNELEANYEEYKNNAVVSGFPVHNYQLYVSYKTYTFGDIVSLAIETYQYTGGAHGSTNMGYYNIDAKSGKALSLSNLFKKDIDYITIINDEIRNQIEEQRKTGEDIYFEGDMGFKSIETNHPFYINDGNLILHFGQYEIAPYAAGMPEFAIPFAVLKESLHEGFGVCIEDGR